MSSGWHTLALLSHPDEIANFDFPQHAVALRRFRTSTQCQWCSVSWFEFHRKPAEETMLAIEFSAIVPINMNNHHPGIFRNLVTEALKGRRVVLKSKANVAHTEFLWKDFLKEYLHINRWKIENTFCARHVRIIYTPAQALDWRFLWIPYPLGNSYR